MQLSRLEIQHLRNLTGAKVTPGSIFNLIYGENGSGKTSFLEAIYFLGLGKSFRTHHNQRVIQQGQENFSVFGILQEKDFSTPMGIQRNREGEMQIRIREQHVASPVELAKLLPLQLINADSHRQLLSTPKYRRQFLDWGLFHVEQSFLPVWQRAARALKQRNAALRANASLAEIQLWSHELIAAAMPLDQLRRTYLQQLHPVFQAISQLFLENIEITWHYQRGWPADKDL
jgi:DNA replication and repair protein RecF